MSIKYTIIIFGTFLITTSTFIYLMILGDIEEFINQLKWILRFITPLIIIPLIFISIRKDYKDKLSCQRPSKLLIGRRKMYIPSGYVGRRNVHSVGL